ncbi:MAG: translation initiation factor IF-2 [bacterium]
MAKKIVKKESPKKEVRKSNIPAQNVNKDEKGVLIFSQGMTLAEVATGLGKTSAELIKKLFLTGVIATQNQALDRETIELLAMDFDYEVKDEVVTDVTRFDEFEIIDDEKDLAERPCIVTIMGHVDHGKTTLLDYIRNSKVVNSEAGGITQHIGAYQVKKNDKLITFIDTPGHAAFTQMRARGAKVTDLIILVVAADDGVMPQTKEAIQHAKAANCPIIVAVNKIDKPGANKDRVMQELVEFELVPEEWGGSTIYVEISALKGINIDGLLEMVQLQAELLELKANPTRLATGTVIEAQLDKGRGPVATLLVQNGTLRVGDNVVCGDTCGKVRSMEDELKRKITEALPSKAVVITGLDEVPNAGDKFMVLTEERQARDIADARKHRSKVQQYATKPVSLEQMFSKLDDKRKELNLIIKGDVVGSLEALKGSIAKIDVENTVVNIIRDSVGAITDTDIILAAASNAIIIGFNVRPSLQVRQAASDKGVEIRLYSVIYKVLDEVKAALTGMLDPIFEEVVTGQAEVRALFKVSKLGTIAGSFVTDGVIERNSLMRVIRDGIVVHEGKMSTLQRFKDSVKEVRNGYECGIMIENFNDIKEGDIFEASVMREVKRK